MSPSERTSAIRLLGEAGRTGSGDIAHIRSSLRQASMDPDPDVAARAQEEYERLVEHDENR